MSLRNMAHRRKMLIADKAFWKPEQLEIKETLFTNIKINLNNSFLLQVTGMVSRKDLAKFRAEAKRGIVQIETLEISDL